MAWQDGFWFDGFWFASNWQGQSEGAPPPTAETLPIGIVGRMFQGRPVFAKRRIRRTWAGITATGNLTGTLTAVVNLAASLNAQSLIETTATAIASAAATIGGRGRMFPYGDTVNVLRLRILAEDEELLLV